MEKHLIIYFNLIPLMGCIMLTSANKIVYDGVYLQNYNSTIVKDVLFTFKRFNRTSPAINLTLTLTKDLGDRVKVYVDIAMKHVSEYKDTGLRLNYSLCQIQHIKTNDMHTLFQKINFNFCKLNKGTYRLLNFMPGEFKDATKILGSFKLTIQLLENGIKFIDSLWVVQVVPE